MVQPRHVDGERLVGREHAQVGVGADRDPAPVVEPDPVGRSRRHPAHHVGQRVPARRGRPVHTAGSPSCTEAIPPQAPAEVAGARALQLGRARRVVGDHEVDVAGGQRGPQRRRGCRRSRIGGQHLNSVAPSGDLARRRRSGSAGRSRRDTSTPAARAVAQRRHARRRRERCTTCARPPVGRACVERPASIARLLGARAAGRRGSRRTSPPSSGASSISVAVLGVHDHQRAEPGRLGHRGARTPSASRCGNSSTPGVEQEALEAEDPGLVQRRQVGEVAGHGAAPEPDVDAAPGRAATARFASSAATVVVGGIAVERHVHDRGHAARRGRPGRGREPLPLGAARLVDVDVGVDQAGQQHLVVGERRRPARRPARASYGVTAAIRPSADPDARRDLASADDRAPGADAGARSAATVGRVAERG